MWRSINATLFVYKQVAEHQGVPEYARKKAKDTVKIHAAAGSPDISHYVLNDEMYAINETIQDNKET